MDSIHVAAKINSYAVTVLRPKPNGYEEQLKITSWCHFYLYWTRHIAKSAFLNLLVTNFGLGPAKSYVRENPSVHDELHWLQWVSQFSGCNNQSKQSLHKAQCFILLVFESESLSFSLGEISKDSFPFLRDVLAEVHPTLHVPSSRAGLDWLFGAVSSPHTFCPGCLHLFIFLLPNISPLIFSSLVFISSEKQV